MVGEGYSKGLPFVPGDDICSCHFKTSLIMKCAHFCGIAADLFVFLEKIDIKVQRAHGIMRLVIFWNLLLLAAVQGILNTIVLCTASVRSRMRLTYRQCKFDKCL